MMNNVHTDNTPNPKTTVDCQVFNGRQYWLHLGLTKKLNYHEQKMLKK